MPVKKITIVKKEKDPQVGQAQAAVSEVAARPVAAEIEDPEKEEIHQEDEDEGDEDEADPTGSGNKALPETQGDVVPRGTVVISLSMMDWEPWKPIMLDAMAFVSMPRESSGPAMDAVGHWLVKTLGCRDPCKVASGMILPPSHPKLLLLDDFEHQQMAMAVMKAIGAMALVRHDIHTKAEDEEDPMTPPEKRRKVAEQQGSTSRALENSVRRVIGDVASEEVKEVVVDDFLEVMSKNFPEERHQIPPPDYKTPITEPSTQADDGKQCRCQECSIIEDGIVVQCSSTFNAFAALHG